MMSRQRWILICANILCLGIGIGLLSWMSGSLFRIWEYDRSVPGSSNLYRLEGRLVLPTGDVEPSAMVPHFASSGLASFFPQVMETVRIGPQATELSWQGESSSEYVHFADERFPALFPIFKDKSVTLRPGTIYISEDFALRRFGSTDLQDEVIFLDDRPFSISGVFGFDGDTHFDFDMITHVDDPLFRDHSEFAKSSNLHFFSYAYVSVAQNQAPPGADELRLFVAESVPFFSEIPGPSEDILQLSIRPLAELKFDVGLPDDMRIGPTTRMVAMLIVCALVILALSVANYSVMSVALEFDRATEYRVLYANGSSSLQILIHRWVSALLVSAVVVAWSVVFATWFLGTFDAGALDPSHFSNLGVSLGVAVVLAAGIVAVVQLGLSAYIVRQRYQMGVAAGRRLGGSTLGIQTTLAGTLAALGIAMLAQMVFLAEIDYGYDMEGVYAAELPEPDLLPLVSMLKSSLNEQGGANAHSAYSSWIPFTENRILTTILTEEAETLVVDAIYAEHSLFDVFDIPILAGELPANIDSDGHEALAVVTLSTAQRISNRSPADAVGSFFSEMSPDGMERYRVVAVCQDLQLRSANEGSKPTVILLNREPYWYVATKVPTRDGSAVDRAGAQFGLESHMRFRPVKGLFDEAHRADSTLADSVLRSAILALFLTILGSLAIGCFVAIKLGRTIAIMEIQGIGGPGLLMHFLSHTALPIGVGTFVACILSVIALNEWLDRFLQHSNSIYFWSLGACLGVSAVVLASLVAAFYLTRTRGFAYQLRADWG